MKNPYILFFLCIAFSCLSASESLSDDAILNQHLKDYSQKHKESLQAICQKVHAIYKSISHEKDDKNKSRIAIMFLGRTDLPSGFFSNHPHFTPWSQTSMENFLETNKRLPDVIATVNSLLEELISAVHYHLPHNPNNTPWAGWSRILNFVPLTAPFSAMQLLPAMRHNDALKNFAAQTSSLLIISCIMEREDIPAQHLSTNNLALIKSFAQKHI